MDIFIKELRASKLPLVIGDFGCGDAMLAKSLPHFTVHSFDLVAVNDFVTPCDMKCVPLGSNVLDVAVYCLSLMGTDFMSFIKEVHIWKICNLLNLRLIVC